MIKHIISILSILALLAYLNPLNAQSWQWGKRLGSTYITGTQSDNEIMSDLTSDNAGNIYVAGLVRTSQTISADTHTIPASFSSFSNNIQLSSYRCDGSLRWSKIIGTPNGAYSKSVQTDTMGGVYLLAAIFMQDGLTGFVGNEPAISGTNRSLYIIRIDSTGALDWLATPQSDTISFNNAFNNTYPIDMHVTPSGEVSVMSLLSPGANIGGQLVTTQPDVYMLRYSSQGAFIHADKMPIHCHNNSTYRMSMHMTRSNNGNYIVSAYSFYTDVDSMVVSQTPIEHSFIASYTSDIQLNWLHEFGIRPELDNLFYNPVFTGRPVCDENNNIFASGTCSHSDTLAGHAFVNTITQNIASMPFLVKFNPNGSLIWTQNASVEYPAVAWGIALHADTVAVSGVYPGTLRWENSNLKLQQIANEGRDPFVAVFNANTGMLLKLDSLSGVSGFDEDSRFLTCDPNGSFYLGGNFGTYLTVANDGLQAAGDNDYYIAKYGNDHCVIVPPNSIETLDNSTINIFPNPSSGLIEIQLSEHAEQLDVIDMNGRLVNRIAPNSGLKYQINLPNSGVYLIRINTGKSLICKRIVRL